VENRAGLALFRFLMLDGSHLVDAVVSIPLPGQPVAATNGADRGSHATDVPRRFLAGPENALAETAIRAVLAKTHPAYNPVVFFGPSGTGKSHLARGLADSYDDNRRRRAVVYTMAVDFAREFLDAVETQATDEFRDRYRKASLVVVEDVDYLADKEAAQHELLHTLDDRLATGRRTVLTSRVAPGRLREMLTGLRARLTAGLTVPLVPPRREARLAILRELAASRGLDLSADVLRILADGSTGTVPELVGTLTELQMWEQREATMLDTATVRRYLARRNGASQPALTRIALLTARSFSLKVADLRSASRRRAVVTARDVAMYLARQLTQSSLHQIGRYFGGRDHTTVLHGCRQMERRLKTEPAIQQTVEQLRGRLYHARP